MYRLPRSVLGLALVLCLAGCLGPAPMPVDDGEPAPSGTPGPGTYLFCFWNVENFFDDQDDDRHTRGDKQYDDWFAHDQAALRQKLDNLAEVLLGMNDGKGPDVLALAEVESLRAAELLQETLNARLGSRALPYASVLFENPKGGRHIATAVLTRLPAKRNRTRLLGSRLRILQGQIHVADRPLTVIASHWSSRLSDRTGATRAGKYADLIYGHFKGAYIANPKVDFLVCGDFNDNPDDESVTAHLHATGDADAVIAGGDDPKLLNLMAPLWKDRAASIYNRATPYLFDQICVSPGLLDDEGWSVEPGTARVVRQMAHPNGRPNRFGGPRDRLPLTARGASDHFPVVVRLRVR